MIIKSLPSTYRGVLFRSRLEARWAALFDSFQIQWVHEPDGFSTPSGNYLPDFYLPEFHTYVEVKPGPLMHDEVAICSVAEQTGAKVLVLDSPVVACRQYVFVECGGTYWNDMCWCSSCLTDGSSNEKISSLYTGISGGDEPCRGHSIPCEFCTGREPAKIRAARNLRFENGVAG